VRGRYCKSGGQSHICTNQQLIAAKTKVAETVGCRSGTYSFLQQGSTPLGHRTCSSLPVVDEWLQRQAGQLLTDKHVVFIGSSTARYQYLNLAHHLLLGRAPSYTLTHKGLELLAAMNITNRPTKAGNYESYWSQWNLASNRLLNQGEGGSEVCDCFRGLPSSANNDLVSEKQMHNVDMRYATSYRHRAALTYVQWFMDEIPFRGHWHPELGYPIRVSCAPGECGPPYHWQLGGQSGEQLDALLKRAAPLSPAMPAPGVRPTASYVEPLVVLLDNVIMQLQPRPTHILIGAPWPGDINGATWMSMARFAELLAAGNRIMSRSSGNAIRFVWKTDTQPAPCSLGALSRKVMEPHVAQYRELVQRNPLWGLFDLWNATAAFGNECYEDKIHFNEIARTHFNALLLRDVFKKSK